MNFHPATPSHTEQDENPNQPNQPELITERLTLRHLREADIPDIVESCRDPQMIRYTRVPLNYTRADAEDSLLTTARQIAAGQIQRWAIDASGVFAGSIELRLPEGTPESPGTRADLGYYTAPKARGKGYMTEALRAVLGYAFDPLGLGLETVRWTALAGNEPSEKVAVKAGFTGIYDDINPNSGRPDENGHPVQHRVRRADMTRTQFAALWTDPLG